MKETLYTVSMFNNKDINKISKIIEHRNSTHEDKIDFKIDKNSEYYSFIYLTPLSHKQKTFVMIMEKLLKEKRGAL